MPSTVTANHTALEEGSDRTKSMPWGTEELEMRDAMQNTTQSFLPRHKYPNINSLQRSLHNHPVQTTSLRTIIVTTHSSLTTLPPSTKPALLFQPRLLSAKNKLVDNLAFRQVTTPARTTMHTSATTTDHRDAYLRLIALVNEFDTG